MSSGDRGAQSSSLCRRTSANSSYRRAVVSVVAVAGVISYRFSLYLETRSGLMLPNFFGSFAPASMGAEQPGQKVGRSCGQTTDYHRLERAAHGAGPGQSAFDPAENDQRRQGD